MQCKVMREGFKKKRHNQFYTGSSQRATSSLLCTTCKESFTNSINYSHTINQPIPTPRRNQNLNQLLPAVSNQFQQKHQANSYSPNQSISTPRRNQNPAKLINCSPQPPINFSRNTRLIPIAQTSQFLLPVEIRTLLN